ncbi:acetyl-CoA carboxylase biotin carboxyl carrier protein [Phytoactinopolyspora halotolerans]|uniref:Biotin carboxyl carrier protein of acetyl-CoA carboxylase n=1 Tax=Phytoactinopolyspora halotolerans TaxID=1981512 RepID=A0A6L9S1T9_9ACTN|nr:acetyl-CoA carboxylase biotin carboxyl carrier protein [Phytoactinopolyspora halotolerans]NED99175.1 acetyl-CoA carboxylase biotin carboxyl carrier protein [Phytoactinopolyspora halotolerans]
MTAGEAELDTRAGLVTHLREEASKLISELDGRVRSVQVDAGDCAVRVEWTEPRATVVAADSPAGSVVVQPEAGDRAVADTGRTDAGTATTHAVSAPLVGTFYRRPSPEAEPFVELGDVVEAGQTLAIVEAMKLMNEIKADRPGRVSAIGPEDGDMVEFGQVLVELSTD